MQSLSVITLLSFAFIMPLQGRCDDLSTWQAKALSGVQQLQNAELWVGGAVGVYFQGNTSIGFIGAVNPTAGVAPTSQSIFEIGSASKSFTGILLASIVADHPGMSVDDTLSKFIPELSGTFSGKITLRQLATHTSGLPRLPCNDPKLAYCFNPKNPANPYVDYTSTQLINYLKVFTRNDSGPYPRDYSNTGAATLGYALTRIQSKSFDDLLAQRITEPLGMTNTTVERTSIASVDFLDGYDIGRSSIPHWEWDVFAPTGGILSNADDMMKYLSANVNPPASALGQAIQMSQSLGLGWDSLPGAPIVWKNGQTAGFHSIILINPKQKTGIFVLSNMGSSYGDAVATMPFNIPIPDLVGATISPADIQSYVGKYLCTKDNMPVEIVNPSKFLFLQADGLKLRLDSVTDLEFNAFDGVNSDGYHKVSFIKLPNGQISGLVLHLNTRTNSNKYIDTTCSKQ